VLETGAAGSSSGTPSRNWMYNAMMRTLDRVAAHALSAWNRGKYHTYLISWAV